MIQIEIGSIDFVQSFVRERERKIGLDYNCRRRCLSRYEKMWNRIAINQNHRHISHAIDDWKYYWFSFEILSICSRKQNRINKLWSYTFVIASSSFLNLNFLLTFFNFLLSKLFNQFSLSLSAGILFEEKLKILALDYFYR